MEDMYLVGCPFRFHLPRYPGVNSTWKQQKYILEKRNRSVGQDNGRTEKIWHNHPIGRTEEGRFSESEEIRSEHKL